jgi:glycosyltransferase involved in cell wall biosynthesis
VALIADEIIVVDSYSTDATIAIASEKGAIVHQTTFNGYVLQKKKAIQFAKHDLVLLLDADEILSPTLQRSMLQVKYKGTGWVYAMKRCSFFCGTAIRHGLWYPDKKIRLFDRRYATCGGMNPHDTIILNRPAAIHLLEGELFHYAFDSIEEYLIRNDQISSIAAHAYFEAGIKKVGQN